MSKVVRSVKNVTKGYTNAQVKVRNATSNDPWGPVGSDMAEIAQLTFADTATFYEIMDILDKRLNDKGKNWRHVLKSLKVLDYCLHEGSELVVTWARKNIYIIKTLREFQHIDEDGRDVGQNIRVSAKELTALIMDEERLRSERRDRKSWKSRVSGIDEHDEHAPTRPKERKREQPRQRTDDEDLEYRLALEASKNEAEEDAKRRAAGKPVDDDDDLAKAIKLSKEEEALRRRELEEANANSLFDDTPATQPQPTGWNQGYQQQPTVDWFGNVIDPQQAQNTGYPAQNTGYQNGYGYPQNTGMNQPLGNNYMQPQQTAFNMNNNSPYGQQPNGFGAFGQQPQQQTQPQEQALPTGNNNPWGSNPSLQSGALAPTPTGSNNPFAQGINRPQSAQPIRQPTLSSLSEQKATTAFNPIMNFSSPQQAPPQQQQPSQPSPSPFQSQEPSKPQDPHHARLNQLLASGEGMDTFGNTGEMRIPAQHTAPGTFVNSAGQNLGRLTGTPTGNPFLSNQFTGMPQTRMPPAQTGPAAGFGASYGGGGANPFGAPPGGSQQQRNHNGNLIDL
ncbi:ENTH-domain-containing protein [Microthyrium microscopicum]|uniref:ENTH-domain-containing protein n=1 Tax=Microthyrium microscopicum TaxID=703497 RepID=A0A6A6UQF6_9PEZI|nr:ENTH-domain-containing protein [Microthyrium microscopicum]